MKCKHCFKCAVMDQLATLAKLAAHFLLQANMPNDRQIYAEDWRFPCASNANFWEAINAKIASKCLI